MQPTAMYHMEKFGLPSARMMLVVPIDRKSAAMNQSRMRKYSAA